MAIQETADAVLRPPASTERVLSADTPSTAKPSLTGAGSVGPTPSPGLRIPPPDLMWCGDAQGKTLALSKCIVPEAMLARLQAAIQEGVRCALDNAKAAARMNGESANLVVDLDSRQGTRRAKAAPPGTLGKQDAAPLVRCVEDRLKALPEMAEANALPGSQPASREAVPVKWRFSILLAFPRGPSDKLGGPGWISPR